MITRIDAVLARGLSRWVDFVGRHAHLVVVATLFVCAAAGCYAALTLRINSDNLSLLPAELPSRRAHVEFIRHFPNLEEALFVVVDGETPELARDAAAELTDRFQQEPDYFTSAYLPGGGDFFERNGLLYRTPEELDDFADAIARIQPLIAEFEVDPTLAHVAEIVREGLDEVGDEDESAEQWMMLLDRIGDASVASYEEFPIAVSWEELLLNGSALEVSTRRAIVVHPVLDYADLLQSRRPLERIHSIAREQGYVPERGVTVRITGNPALNHDEMIGFAIDIGIAGAFCFVLVTFILWRALRSFRIVIAAIVTLLAGLLGTAGFATLAIGELNLMSLTFAILFIGLGVDFCIHLGAGYTEELWNGHSPRDSMRLAASRVGAALAFCTLTTAIGFYVFVPTDYRGVGELGLICGSGMFIIFFLTLTLFPALLSSWLRIDPARNLGSQPSYRAGPLASLQRHARAIRWAALGAAVAGLALLPRLDFDVNVVELRDPGSESVQAFQDLLERTETSPWYLNSLASDLDEAVALATRLEELDSVRHAVTLASYVPERQEEKLEVLEDLQFLFDTPGRVDDGDPDMTIAQQIAALRELQAYLAEQATRLDGRPLAASMGRLREHLRIFLDRAEREDAAEQALAEFEQLLLGPLPQQLERLRRALEAEEIGFDSLPDALTERMLAPDGVARVQIFPDVDMSERSNFIAFVEEVQGHTPNLAGVPLNLIEFSRVINSSFRQALLSAVVIISLLLAILWRNFVDVALVMLPLFLGAILTGATMVLLGIDFNFGNVIVIPLLFGIGVDSGIHLVQRARSENGGDNLVGTSTARAVYFSALTTAVSFGSLSLADHNGLASLGIVLTTGLFYTVTSVLVVLPALLSVDWIARGRRRSETA